MEYMMNERELRVHRLVCASIDGVYTVKQVAGALQITPRRVKQLKKAVRELGEGAVIHGNSGRHPSNYTDETLRSRIIGLKQTETYKNTNFTYFRELLEEEEHIKISYTCLTNILKGVGITPPKTRRSAGEKHLRRPRRACFGELVQTDATPYDWFGTGVYYTLHGFIDDATGDILGLYFCENECLAGYFEAFRQVLTKYGVPESIYADRLEVFFVNNKKQENWTIEEQLAGKTLDKTQFGIVAETLGSALIPAGSPQAKGRIERLWETLQGRLPTFFKLHNITDMENANKILPLFIKQFNKHPKFHHEAADAHSKFIPLPKDYDLETLLAAKYTRKTDNSGCFSFQNHIFQIDSKKPIVKKTVVFTFSEKLGFKACFDKVYYPVKYLDFVGDDRHDTLPIVTKRLLYLHFYANARKT